MAHGVYVVGASKELRERLGLDDIILVLEQNRLRWYGHVLRKEDNDWVKKCMKWRVPGIGVGDGGKGGTSPPKLRRKCIFRANIM